MTGKDLVSRIDDILKTKNKKRSALAQYLNITPQSFTDWNKRGNFPKADMLYKIAQYLEVSMEYLITGTHSDTFEVIKAKLAIIKEHIQAIENDLNKYAL